VADLPFLTVVVQCRNERAFIAMCLDSLIANNYPKERIEILVVDGMSEDGTRAIVSDYAEKWPFIRLIDNHKKHATAAMNIGVKNARGQVIAFVSAHATYPTDYMFKCVRSLIQYDVDNVGGIMRTIPRSGTLIAKAIALALSHPFGSGNAYFRIGISQPRLVDTVFGGCYRREVFDRVGLFNEDIARSQDMDFNIRLRRAGGRTLLDPGIECSYFARSTLSDFARHVFDDGKWAVYPLRFGSPLFYPRHLVPLTFVSALIGSLLLAPFLSFFLSAFFGVLGLYVAVSLFFSIQIAVKEREPRYLFWMPVVFGIRHFAHGLGALYGLLLVLMSGKFWELIWQRFHLTN